MSRVVCKDENSPKPLLSYPVKTIFTTRPVFFSPKRLQARLTNIYLSLKSSCSAVEVDGDRSLSSMCDLLQ